MKEWNSENSDKLIQLPRAIHTTAKATHSTFTLYYMYVHVVVLETAMLQCYCGS